PAGSWSRLERRAHDAGCCGEDLSSRRPDADLLARRGSRSRRCCMSGAKPRGESGGGEGGAGCRCAARGRLIRRPGMTYRQSTADGLSPAARITHEIVARLEAGVRPWVKPWRGAAVSRPLRACGTPYRGINVFWLWLVAD